MSLPSRPNTSPGMPARRAALTTFTAGVLGVLGILVASSLGADTVVVTEASDVVHACAVSGTGVCSLRDAILFANITPGSTITFNIPGSGVHTISPATALPAITAPTMIFGYTQPGSAMNPGPPGIGRTAAIILIELDGSVENGSTTGVGLTISGGGSWVFGLAIGGWANVGILLQTNGNNQVQGNFIGTSPAGTSAHANGVGVRVTDATGNLIGGPGELFSRGAQFVNLISGNGTGIDVQAPGTVIQQNIVGLNAGGDQALSNNLGISINAANVTVGDIFNFELSRNVVSGNLTSGIRIQGGSSTGCLILANSLGGAQDTPIGNAGAGILVTSAPGVTIQRNTVVGNGGPGIDLATSTGTMIIDNSIGSAAGGNAVAGIRANACSGTVIGGASHGNTLANNNGPAIVVLGAGSGNRISQNSIFANGGLGIDLGNDGATPNDGCDVDSGPNDLQNFPNLLSASSVGGNTTIQGTLNAVAMTIYTIEFFSNDACDPTGFGEGQMFLGSTMVMTDSSCAASFDVTLPVASRGVMTATVTDPFGSTSEFSNCIPLAQQFHTTTACRLIDTRGPASAYGAPALAAGADRTFVIAGKCGVPATAHAVVFNFTVTQPTNSGDLRAFLGGSTLPLVSTMNWRSGQTRANNAVVSLGPAGDIVIHVDQASGTVDFIADIYGYFE